MITIAITIVNRFRGEKRHCSRHWQISHGQLHSFCAEDVAGQLHQHYERKWVKCINGRQEGHGQYSLIFFFGTYHCKQVLRHCRNARWWSRSFSRQRMRLLWHHSPRTNAHRGIFSRTESWRSWQIRQNSLGEHWSMYNVVLYHSCLHVYHREIITRIGHHPLDKTVETKQNGMS